MRLILFSKPGCHLCEGLQEKLEQIQTIAIELEIRDITTRDDWFQAYQYEIPVLYLDAGSDRNSPVNESDATALIRLPRLSPRSTVQQVAQMLQNYRVQNTSE
ncbi:glutaredoxin family protein [Oculatella sp. LEGE 06141]|uniref:glutaredoxin family protein n=1 Tax=Oculatella sp. LEGE 06141 TaxID=1828648 RepID=UPI00187FD9E5|nr:glutaredoxin family protein [Oculatella sp. LEGE 06141]MBE9179015.1 glutaredoxin family protein [Oculatella sp. LEGE 06141]